MKITLVDISLSFNTADFRSYFKTLIFHCGGFSTWPVLRIWK